MLPLVVFAIRRRTLTPWIFVAMVIGADPTFPGCLIECYAVAMFRMTDEMGGDDKVLCVATADTRRKHISDLASVPEHMLLEIEHFFSVYKDLEPGKSVEGAHWAGRADAERVINEAIARATEAGVSTARWKAPFGHAADHTVGHSDEDIAAASAKAREELATKERPLSDD